MKRSADSEIASNERVVKPKIGISETNRVKVAIKAAVIHNGIIFSSLPQFFSP